MGPLAALNHLLNFAAPALLVAAMVSASHFFFRKKTALSLAYWQLFAINFGVSCLALLAGLYFFGRDGKMVSYASMVTVCATSQWLMVRGWRG
jgi:hypothetical protein